MEAKQIIEELYQSGAKSLEALRMSSVSPNSEKMLREWGISEAAQMIGKTAQTLRNTEKEKKVPPARQVLNGKRYERVYSLADINKLRDFFGTRPTKPKNGETAVIAMTNFKGGVGKSFTTLSVSQAFAMKGYKVLVIDTDSQGTSTHLGAGCIPDLHIDAEKTLLSCLIGETNNISGCIIKTPWDGLDMIPANLNLYNSEMVIPAQIYEYKHRTGGLIDFYARLKNALDKIKDNYDLIIIDTPPSLGVITLNVLFAVNAIIIPLLPSEVDYCSTVQFLNMVSEALSRLPSKEYNFIKLLISRHKPSFEQPKIMEQVIRKVFSSSVLTHYMIETEAVSKASADMRTIYEVKPYKNDLKTFKRALRKMDEVVSEIELLIKGIWNTDRE